MSTETPHFELKPLSREGIEAALKKAERYRLLNEPWEAESICRDILENDPENQDALIALILALTDQIRLSASADVGSVQELLPRLKGEYERAYYAGILAERRGKALLKRGAPGSGPLIYDWLRRAMEHYEEAERLRPPGNESSILRWNTCARIIMRHEHIRPAPRERTPTFLE
ncbi:MAG: hypothetical protein ACE5JR_06525 [Gemmatimonadota bacterium]